MKVTKGVAIESLVPGADCVVINNSEIRWLSKDKTQPSDDAIANEVTRLQAIQDYKEPRLRSIHHLMSKWTCYLRLLTQMIH